MQKDVFLSGEGDAWYRRNKSQLDLADNDSVVELIKQQQLSPSRVLEIGCSSGKRLSAINHIFGASCCGIDVSNEAILTGNNQYQNITLSVGTADDLQFENDTFDLVIFGFCLYLCDRKDLFRIASEADRVLRDKGMIIIKDFHPPFPYKNKYSHCDNIYSYKMDYSRLFTWNPSYTLLSNNIIGHSGIESRTIIDERISLSLLYKSVEDAYTQQPG